MKKHLIAVHKVPEFKAALARVNLNLNEKRQRLPAEVRSSKPRKYARKICPYRYCQLRVVRMENHQRVVHKLSGPLYKEMLYKAVRVDEENVVQAIDYFKTTGEDEKYVMFMLYLSLVKIYGNIIMFKTLSN